MKPYLKPYVDFESQPLLSTYFPDQRGCSNLSFSVVRIAEIVRIIVWFRLFHFFWFLGPFGYLFSFGRNQDVFCVPSFVKYSEQQKKMVVDDVELNPVDYDFVG